MISNSTTIVNENDLNNYDYTGAMIYIIIVLLWYSIGIIFMLAMQMRARSETIEDSARRRTKLLIRNLRDQTNTKEILEELVDKQKRARLWDIYLGTQTQTKDKLTRAETIRIRHIEKQLATINRNHQLTNETFFSQDDEIRSSGNQSYSRQITAPIPVHSPLHRRSSFDQQTLERWKALSNQPKPPTIRKYFYRHQKKPLAIIHQESTNDQIDILTRHQTESDLHQTPTYDERENPYLTYFYKSTNHPNILTSEYLPVSFDHSIEQN